MTRYPRPRPVLIDTFQMDLDGRSLTCSLRVSLRARYVRLEYRQGGLIITIPRMYRRENLSYLLEQKKRWLISMMDKYGSAAQAAIPRELQNGDTIPYLGGILTLVTLPGGNGHSDVILEGTCLLVGTGIPLKQSITSWYRQQAETLFAQRVQELAGELGVVCTKLSVRQAKTRWGSCSRKASLSLNWKLIMAPLVVIDYVIIHELAHIREMNHSRRFWKVVAEHCPEWREHRQWLREHETGTLGDFTI